jgi:hypothetical protein
VTEALAPVGAVFGEPLLSSMRNGVDERAPVHETPCCVLDPSPVAGQNAPARSRVVAEGMTVARNVERR